MTHLGYFTSKGQCLCPTCIFQRTKRPTSKRKRGGQMRVAFDVNGTLLTNDKKPNYAVIQLFKWFVANGDELVVWSNGGSTYALSVVTKLGLTEAWIAEKGKVDVDLAVDDDPECSLGKYQIIIGGSHV